MKIQARFEAGDRWRQDRNGHPAASAGVGNRAQRRRRLLDGVAMAHIREVIPIVEQNLGKVREPTYFSQAQEQIQIFACG